MVSLSTWNSYQDGPSSKWSLIRVVFHHGRLTSDDLSSRWVFIKMVSHHGTLIRMVLHKSGLSSWQSLTVVWSFIKVGWHEMVFYQGSFSSDGLSSGWFIRMVSHKVVSIGGLSSGGIIRWSFIFVACQQGGFLSGCLSPGWSLISMVSLHVIFYNGGLIRWSLPEWFLIRWSFIRWSLIMAVSHHGCLSSGGLSSQRSLIMLSLIRWSVIWVVCHHGSLSSGSLSSGCSLIRVVSH